MVRQNGRWAHKTFGYYTIVDQVDGTSEREPIDYARLLNNESKLKDVPRIDSRGG